MVFYFMFSEQGDEERRDRAHSCPKRLQPGNNKNNNKNKNNNNDNKISYAGTVE
jgi:hypothetical protein